MSFNPIVNRNLQVLANEGDWHKMAAYLEALTNSAFRAASDILADSVLPQLAAEDFWECFNVIALSDTKAYLMTFMKAAVVKYTMGTLDFNNKRFVAFALSTRGLETSLDRQKTLKKLLPVLTTHAQIEGVLDAFCESDIDMKLKYLIQADESKPGYYAIFKLLRMLDSPADVTKNYLLHILRRSTPMAFNFVSMMRDYFGIESLNAQYSLRLQPYELSRLETSYDEFVKSLSRML